MLTKEQIEESRERRYEEIRDGLLDKLKKLETEAVRDIAILFNGDELKALECVHDIFLEVIELQWIVKYRKNQRGSW